MTSDVTKNQRSPGATRDLKHLFPLPAKHGLKTRVAFLKPRVAPGLR